MNGVHTFWAVKRRSLLYLAFYKRNFYDFYGSLDVEFQKKNDKERNVDTYAQIDSLRASENDDSLREKIGDKKMTDDLNVEKVNECLVTPISALNERKPVKIDPKNISFKVKQNLSSNGRI